MKKNILFVGMLVLFFMFVSVCSGIVLKGSLGDFVFEKIEMRIYKLLKGNVIIFVYLKCIVIDFYVGELFFVGVNVVGLGLWLFDNLFLKLKLKNVKDVGDLISVEKVMEF